MLNRRNVIIGILAVILGCVLLGGAFAAGRASSRFTAAPRVQVRTQVERAPQAEQQAPEVSPPGQDARGRDGRFDRQSGRHMGGRGGGSGFFGSIFGFIFGALRMLFNLALIGVGVALILMNWDRIRDFWQARTAGDTPPSAKEAAVSAAAEAEDEAEA